MIFGVGIFFDIVNPNMVLILLLYVLILLIKSMFIRIMFVSIVLFTANMVVHAQGIANCSTCGTELLRAQDIDTLSVDELRLFTNEIYARKGYRFSNERYQDYFQSFDWYKPLADNSLVKLSNIEEKNIKLLQDRRKVREDERQIILAYFKGLKQLAVNNNDAELNKLFANLEYQEMASVDEMKQTLLYINFDDVHWFKNKGLYRVEVDNGYVKIVYSFSVTNEGIILAYNYMAHSDIMEDFDTMFSDYMSESEYAVWWVFSLVNGKIVLTKVDGAG